jgi:Amt family ammonium transporter
MFGDSLGGVIGNPLQLSVTYASHGMEWRFLQLGFASVAATIISGAIAGRSTLLSNALVALAVGGFVYPVFGHWMWNEGGWLAGVFHVEDFAGSGVVHLIGGLAALICAHVLGARREARKEDGSLKPYLSPRSLPHVTTGVVFLWIGWIGFNGGSVAMLDFHTPVDGVPRGWLVVGEAIMATCVAAGAGGLIALFAATFHRRFFGPGRGLRLSDFLVQNMGFDPYATLSGAMGGMVAITANCRWVADDLGVAILIGMAGGLVSFLCSLWVKARIDDPVDAVAVHAGAGALGLLLAARAQEASFEGQLLALSAAVALTAVTVYPLARFLRWLDLFRVSAEDEEIGLSWEPPVKAIVSYSVGETDRASSKPNRMPGAKS